MRIEEVNILHGNPYNDEYVLIKEKEEILVVHSDYFFQESAILFTVGHRMTDWSDQMLIDSAKVVVDFLNSHPKAPF